MSESKSTGLDIPSPSLLGSSKCSEKITGDVTCGTCNQKHLTADSQNEQKAALKVCLDTLFFDDNMSRPLTLSSLKVLNEAKSKLSEADALFIEGLCLPGSHESFKYFFQAEQKGCDHPILHMLIGECYRSGNRGVAADATKALQYYDKAIKGGFTMAYLGIYALHKFGSGEVEGDKGKAFNYLLDLEKADNVAGCVLVQIGQCYFQGDGCKEDLSKAALYHQRALDIGYTPYNSLSIAMWGPFSKIPQKKDKAVLTLSEVEKKGLALKDDRILLLAIKCLIEDNTNPNADVLGTFKSAGEMALHYCDVLISRGSPLGYYQKGRIYQYNEVNIPKDATKAVALWEEADRLGLADFDIYFNGLVEAYTHEIGVPANGLKVLEYCEKALQCIVDRSKVVKVFESMVEVYENGIAPVSQDGTKMIECYERALQHVSSAEEKMEIYRRMMYVYQMPLPPLVPTMEKFQELMMKMQSLSRGMEGHMHE